MKKIGLITFFWNNYGSALQCYATMQFLKKNGYEVTLIQKVPFGEDPDVIEENRRRHPQFQEDFDKFMQSLTSAKATVSESSLQKINEFIGTELKPREFTSAQLKEIGESDEYSAFIVGSDQVWNVTLGMISPQFFLLFAPSEKRIALCPSFGLEHVPEYLREDLRDVLNEYERLSAREDAGVRIIRELTGREAERLADPTVLLSPDEWRDFAGKKEENEKYILLHFLDEPNEIAKKHIRYLAEATGWELKCFATWQETFSEIGDVSLIDGGPKDYVRIIANAELVCTDSFHTTMFSLNIESNFYTYDRQYAHGVSQISRVVTALTFYGLMDRLIMDENFETGIESLPIHYEIEEKKNKEREHIQNYLLQEVSKRSL